jgi:uroporphyrinogen decarboxylase
MSSSVFLETLSGKRNSKTPLWMMRQAGRYLPEYRRIRETQSDFISFCLNPEKACEVTLQPISRFGFDAAIIFSDILMVPWALDRNVRFIPGTGPKLDRLMPEDALDFTKLDLIEDRLSPVGSALSMTRAKLDADKALIGFAGAPWTVITYIIEGGSSRDFVATRQWLWSHPKEFDRLLDYITEATIKFLTVQARSGADALMLFDSWASAVPASMRKKIVIAPIVKIITALRAEGIDLPIIGFPKGIGEGIIEYAEESDVNALAIDHMTDPIWVNDVVSKTMPIQGNLDPLSLISGGGEMLQSIDNILEAFQDRPHIFNLGHGITPPTPISNVEAMVARVRGSN